MTSVREKAQSPTPRYIATTTVPLAVILVISLLWSALLASDVPDPMAQHFSGRGEADGFGSPLSVVASLTGIGFATLLLFFLLSRGGMSSGRSARFNAGIMGFTITLLSVLQVRLFVDQQNLDSAQDARISTSTVLWMIIVPLLVAVAVAVIAKPDESPRTESTTVVPDLGIPSDSPAAWHRTETMTAWVQIPLYIVICFSIILCIKSGLPLWSIVLLILTVGLPVAACSGWRLRVDSRGFSYASPVGIPRSVVPIDDISFAEAVDIQPGNWGGWGWRFNGTGTGLITGGGPGFRITRKNRKIIEVTCADAPNALAVLKHHGVTTR